MERHQFDLRYLAGRCARLHGLDLGIDGPADLMSNRRRAGYGRFGSNWLARIPAAGAGGSIC